VKPRTSKLGYYIQCGRRALFDDLVDQGLLAPDPASGAPSPYADLGTLIHYHTQGILGATWPAGETDASMAPDQAQLDNACTLFSGPTTRDLAVMKSANLAAAVITRLTDHPWLAEPAYDDGSLSGHLDLLSADGKHIVDIKTTSRQPEKNQIKPEHLAQLAGYRLLQGSADFGHIVYVDSTKGAWVAVHTVDFTSPAMVVYLDDMRSFVHQLNAGLVGTIPNLGHHCVTGFCPYKAICRDKLMPAPVMPTTTVPDVISACRTSDPFRTVA
jgi:hypothetical protein